MPVAVVYRPPGMSAEQYKESWSGAEGQPVSTPRGLVFHAGIGEGEDFLAVSVWESQEAYDEFAPVFKQAMASMGFDFGTPARLAVHHMIGP